MDLVPASGTTWVQSSCRPGWGLRGVGCQMPPHSHCHHIWATSVALDLAVFQAKRDGVMRISVTSYSYRLIHRFASFLSSLSSLSFSFPSLVFCQIICCFFFSVLIAHCLVSLPLNPPQSNIFFCLESDLHE